LGARFGVSPGLGKALEAWLAPAIESVRPTFSPERVPILLAAAARLADVGARLHPDHRAMLTFDQVLRAPIAGQSHAERAFLAATVFTRYEPDAPLPQSDTLGRILSPERLHRARTLGLALRLGSDLSGRTPALLASTRLSLEDRELVLTADPAYADLLLGEQTRKRLSALADHLDMMPAARAA
jgi:exopolyphosphatase/guanosine-5'-triphosphate,3'-diphosphate pyrophosphatase